MKKITVILPCAGEGSRMGLDTPKELFEIGGVKLIDFSLAHIRAFPNPDVLRVAVVIRAAKQDVADYVREQLTGIDVTRVMFDDNYHEWPGSVYSAKKCFSRYNLVLLPDSFLSLARGVSLEPVTTYPPGDGGFEGESLTGRVMKKLAEHGVVFGWVKCSHRDTLAGMGAMKVEKGLVTAFQDKPGKGFEGFNGLWGCYGFRREWGRGLYDFLTASVRHQPVSLQKQGFYPPGTVDIAAYYDLGTPERASAFNSSINSS
jgi:hypothetical protein